MRPGSLLRLALYKSQQIGLQASWRKSFKHFNRVLLSASIYIYTDSETKASAASRAPIQQPINNQEWTRYPQRIRPG